LVVAAPGRTCQEVITVPEVSVSTADALAERAHRGQVDKAGNPYINHVRAVAELLAPLGPHAQMAGLLHDVVEDTDVTLDDLREAGYPDDVIRAVDSVTRRDNETYMAMIRRAAADPLGRRVKIADNAHNTGRLDALDEPVRSGMARRYLRARQVLLAAQAQAGQELAGARRDGDDAARG
jgi:(p)ppGpp synthase/HD superfamily hydrolase